MNIKRYLSLLLAALLALTFCPQAQAFWMWTPESGKWVNPKYDAKSTPQDQLAFAHGFFGAGKYAEAKREYQKLLKAFPKSREAAEAQFYIGRVWEELKKYFEAVEAYQKVIDRYPFSELGPKVVERQYFIANLLLEGKGKDSHYASSLLGTDYNVVEIFRKVIKNDPYGSFAPASQYKIGLFLLQKQEYQSARDEFEKTVNDYPDSKWAESARYQIAVADAKRSVKAQYDQNVTNIAVEGFKDFVQTNPDSELSKDAKAEIDRLRVKEAENAFVVAKYYEKNKQFKAAKIYYQGVADKYSDTDWADKARKQIKLIDSGSLKK
jgi:outer membrane protein assembly factor BamD